MNLPDLGIYLITDEAMCSSAGVAATVVAAVEGGATVVQLRRPGAGGRALLAGTRELVACSTVPVIVNDRVDVALAGGAGGAHLGQSDLPVPDARRLAGPGLLLGWSVTTVAQAEEASRWPPGTVDYLGVGPVYPTATKPDASTPLGLDGLRRIVSAVPLPCVAIGGIDASNAAAVMGAGVAGVAVVSAICGTPDPKEAAARLRDAVETGRR